MKRKRIEKLVALLLVGILMPVSLFPFPVHAEAIDTHIRGRNYTYEPITYNEIQLTQNTYYQNIGVFHITFELDDEYIGYVLPNYSIQYDNYFYGASTPNWGTLSSTFDRRVFVNGSSFSFDIPINWYSISINTAPGGDPFNYDSYTITSSDVTKYADIDSMDQIINILQDLYDSNDQVEGLLSDQLAQLQLVVSNTSLANDYLDIISQLRQYNIPFESMNVAMYVLRELNSKIIDVFDYSYMTYPLLLLNANDRCLRSYMNRNQKYKFIFLTSSSVVSNQTFIEYFSIPETITVSNYVNYTNSFYISTNGVLRNGYVCSVELVNSSNGLANIFAKQDMYYTPIYFGLVTNKYLSTEFALRFGLSNQLLDDLHIIANGTTQSSSASGSLDQTTSQFSDDASDLVTIEESFNNSMNESLQSVNPTFNMGSSFLTSANWVSQQFNRIVNNTPFASLITFGLTLGLGLLIIGKVRK